MPPGFAASQRVPSRSERRACAAGEPEGPHAFGCALRGGPARGRAARWRDHRRRSGREIPGIDSDNDSLQAAVTKPASRRPRCLPLTLPGCEVRSRALCPRMTSTSSAAGQARVNGSAPSPRTDFSSRRSLVLPVDRSSRSPTCYASSITTTTSPSPTSVLQPARTPGFRNVHAPDV
jgi:hypothetical protein